VNRQRVLRELRKLPRFLLWWMLVIAAGVLMTTLAGDPHRRLGGLWLWVVTLILSGGLLLLSIIALLPRDRR
jgi:hypothetical protein